MFRAGKRVALVRQVPGALHHVNTPNGKPLVRAKRLTELKNLDTTFSKVKNWGVHIVTNGLLITGQNPASSGRAAKVLIETLKKVDAIQPRNNPRRSKCRMY